MRIRTNCPARQNIIFEPAGADMKVFINLLSGIQNYALFLEDIVRGMFRCYRYKDDALREMYYIGARAFPVVLMGGLFVGIILATEVGHQLEQFGAKTLIGRTLSLGMVRELGPIITGLLLAARTGAKNTSELGAMQLSEQIDAFRAFGASPVDRLIVPRTVAALVMFFPLTLVADMTGMLGGMFITVTTFHIDSAFYWNTAINSLTMKDLLVGFSKPFFFAFFIATISCYFGINTKGGTTGLGKNTIKSVVATSITVLLMDFVFTKVVWEII